jgi:hypothetical protein
VGPFQNDNHSQKGQENIELAALILFLPTSQFFSMIVENLKATCYVKESLAYWEGIW